MLRRIKLIFRDFLLLPWTKLRIASVGSAPIHRNESVGQ
jgi:hypothetical protein